MKTIFSLLVIPLIISIQACDKDEDNNNSRAKNNSSSLDLTDQEKLDLNYLREEEKLAHDVYHYAFQAYSTTIFQNISDSEQKHTDAVLDLLIKYNEEDPSKDKTIGEFRDSSLQQLYADLTLTIDTSLNKAYTVGATVEDLDIYDISEMIQRTEKADLLQLYSNLMCGSRNHLRSYVGKLNGNYTPQFVSQSDYNSILSSAKEKCGN